MSRITLSHSRRPFVITGLVLIGLAASAATTQTQSTSNEATLLNRIPAITNRVAVGNQSPTAADCDWARSAYFAEFVGLVTTHQKTFVRFVTLAVPHCDAGSGGTSGFGAVFVIGIESVNCEFAGVVAGFT